ncbi:MAG: methyl-accepting chemotaxis protein [Nitrospirae bacterium]|nr:methyl-accepting chemotaxis protein [Nitrospirota bacterium]
MRFKDLSIGVRVGGGFALLVLGMAVVAGSGWQGLNRVQQNTRFLYEDAVVLEAEFGTATTALLRYRNRVIQAVGAASVEDFKELAGELDGLKDFAEQMLRSATEKLTHASSNSEATAKQVAALQEALTAYWGLDKRTIDQTRASWAAATPADAERLRNAAKQNAFFTAGPALDAAGQALSDIQESLRQGAMGQYVAATATGRTATRTLWLVLLLSVVFATGLSVVIVQGVTRPLHKMNEFLDRLGHGDLRTGVDYAAGDETGAMCANANQFMTRLHTLIVQVATASNSVAASAGLLSKTSGEVRDCSRRQAEQTSQGAAGVEEMSATATSMANGAKEVTSMAQAATRAATEGGQGISNTISGIQALAETVEQSSKRMVSLRERSQEIGNIVKVIEEIADQTNLLALNAAIEAARAGEQGRGFAVVADEVRKLAERTMKATSEVTSMIQAIQSDTDVAVQAMGKGTQQAKAGVELVNGAGVTLSQIVEVVTKATSMVQQLAGSIAEQSHVTGQVASNVQAVAEFSKQNELSIIGLTGATGQLSEMAIDLREAVGQFKLTAGSVEEDPSRFEATRH